MGEPESFSSLMDLVNSHLSKTSVNASQSGDESNFAFPLASVSIQTGMSQTVFTPPNGVMSIPRLGTQDNEINGILAQQVTNMLIAKEKKKQEEKKQEEERLKHENEMRQMKNQRQMINDYNIDLMPSIIYQDKMNKPVPKVKETRKINQIEALLNEVRNLGQGESMKNLKKRSVALPLNRDMSYMLARKVKKGKPSAFGKIISSRMQPVAAPYIKVEINHDAVERFDFSTKSPCDINLENRRNRPQDPYAHMNMVERFMAQSNDAMQNNL